VHGGGHRKKAGIRARGVWDAKSAEKIEPDTRFFLGDLRVFARDIILVVIETYIVPSGLSGNVLQLLRVSNADGRFKLVPVPLSVTPKTLLTRVAQFVGRPGSVTSEEGQHGLVFRGQLRSPGEPLETEATAPEPPPEVAPAAPAPTGGFEKITGADAIAALGQKVTIELIDRGVKVRIRGKQADCETTAKRILKGTPTLASEQGSKYMIEGDLSKSFLRKGANQQGPDAQGVYTRDDGSERTFTAFGENVTAVQAACRTGCREDTMFTIVVNDRSAGQFVISSGKRRSV